MREVQFGEQARVCRLLPCCVCGRRPCVPAHVRSRGAGGRAEDQVPLCTSTPRREGCHEEQHRIGIETFQRLKNINLEVVAQRIHEELANHTHCVAWATQGKAGPVCAICGSAIDPRELKGREIDG